MADKVEWLNKLRNVAKQPPAGGQVKGEPGLNMRQSLSDSSLVSFTLVINSNEVLLNHLGLNWLSTCTANKFICRD